MPQRFVENRFSAKRAKWSYYFFLWRDFKCMTQNVVLSCPEIPGKIKNGLDGIRLEVSTSGSHTSMCSTLLDFRVGGTAPCCIDKQMSKEASTLKLLVALPNRDAPWS